MSEIKYILDGQECNPANRRDIQFELNFEDEQDSRRLEMSVTSLVFVREDYTRIQQYRSTFGDYYAMPLTVQFSDGTNIDYLLDWTDSVVVEEHRRIEVSVKRYKGWDLFFKNADALIFQIVDWDDSDFVEQDYLIIPENLSATFFSLSISVFALQKELAVTTDKLVDNTNAVIKASVPVGIPPATDWGAIIIAGLRLAATLAYFTLVTIAFIKLGQQIIELVFPQLRQFKTIRYKKLIEKGVEYLGYELDSELLDQLSGLTVLPQPTQGAGNWFKEQFQANTLAFTNGYPSQRDTIPTLGAAIKEIEKIFRAETRVIDGVVKIETREFFEQNANQQLLRAFNNQSDISNEYTINSNEQYKRLVAKYQTDATDFNTFNDTAGTVSEVSSEVVVSNDIHLELIKNYAELNINFSRGTKKDELNWLEEAVKEFAKALDIFTGGSSSAKVESRKGALQLSSQYFSNTKLLYCTGSSLVPNQNQFIGTEKILEYHEDGFIQNNQKKVYQGMPLAVTESEFFSLLQNNFVNLSNGQTIEVTKAIWNEEDFIATIDYKLRKLNVNEVTS
jgi:hypothetical protein